MTSGSAETSRARNRTQFGWSITRTRSLAPTGVNDGRVGALESLLTPGRNWSAREARALAAPPVDDGNDRA